MSKYEILRIGYIAALVNEDYKLSEIANMLDIPREKVVAYYNQVCKLRKPIFEEHIALLFFFLFYRR